VLGNGVVTIDVTGKPVTIVKLASEYGVIDGALPVYPA